MHVCRCNCVFTEGNVHFEATTFCSRKASIVAAISQWHWDQRVSGKVLEAGYLLVIAAWKLAVKEFFFFNWQSQGGGAADTLDFGLLSHRETQTFQKGSLKLPKSRCIHSTCCSQETDKRRSFDADDTQTEQQFCCRLTRFSSLFFFNWGNNDCFQK